MIVYSAISLYFLVGLLVLAVFDVVTGRIHTRLYSSAEEIQRRLGQAFYFIGRKTAIIIFLVVLWTFWPMPIYVAVKDMVKNG